MKFGQKKTCKGCYMESDGVCGVKIKKDMFYADVPEEPCFKPRTHKEYLMYDQRIQNANLEILRVK